VSVIYMIMPVGADPSFTDKRRAVLEVARKHEAQVFFPFEHRSTFSMPAAVADMRRADLVVVDLSKERPSCYYELGLAETATANIALIAETGTRIHQVGRPNAVRFYGSLEEYGRLLDEILAVNALSILSTKGPGSHRV
jgi:hypothetical protein